MNTKNIFKTVALAMMMPAMLLTTACSNQDDIANTSNITNKGYALPVTVNVTREDGATRASFDGSKLNFSAGDQLFVEGSHINADRFAGTLTWQSGGTFSGTIYTESPYEGTIDDLLNENYATLLPAGYESYDYLEIIDEGYEARLGENAFNSFATSKKLGVEQLSFEHGEYTSGTGFVLKPQKAILNFTITGLAASTKVTATLSDDEDWTPDIEGEVTTDGSGNATFAIGLEGGSDLNEFSLTVAGNPITLVSSSKKVAAGKIYNITRAVTPPTLAETMTNAGMTVKVKYNYANVVNYCLFSSVGDGTYTFQSGSGFAGADAGCAKALVVEGGKLVFKQNFFDEIDFQWSTRGFSVTFDTSNDTYIQWVGSWVQGQYNPSFISVEVNSVPIALTQIIIQKITVADLVKEDGDSWSDIIDKNSDKIKVDDDYGYYVVRISDGAKLQRNMYGDVWEDVEAYQEYQSMNTYKFEGD